MIIKKIWCKPWSKITNSYSQNWKQREYRDLYFFTFARGFTDLIYIPMKKLLLLFFVLLSTSGILFAGILFTKNKKKDAVKSTKEIRQVVLVKFKSNVTAGQIAEIGKLAKNLQEKSKTLQKLDWGKPLEFKNSEGSNTYDFCFTFKFKNGTNYEIFQQNPLRMEFLGKLIPLTKSRLTYTYRINE